VVGEDEWGKWLDRMQVDAEAVGDDNEDVNKDSESMAGAERRGVYCMAN
jgi:hypothetical protein